ncbi:hypothetical protein ACFX11_014112 [Malus domestica]
MGTTPITMQLALGDGGDGDLSNVCHAGKCFSSETPSTLSTSSPQTPTISTSRPAFSFPTRLAHILIQNDHPKLLTLFFTPNYNPTTSTPSSSPSNPTPLPPSASSIGPAAPLACTTTRSPSAPSFTCCSATGCSLRFPAFSKTSVGQFGTQFHFFDAFSDCFQNHSSVFSLVCRFLIEIFCRNGMLDSSVDTFIRM